MALAEKDQPGEGSSSGIVNILKRLEQTDNEALGETALDAVDEVDSDDADQVPELVDRIEGVDLNDADAIWECLTEEEQNEFRSMLEDGDVSNVMPLLEPWWLINYKIKFVQLANETTPSKEEKELIQRCPPITKNIKRFSTITKKEPSPSTRSNMINVIAAYVFTFRYFNGDFEGVFCEAANCLISISGYLKSNTVYESEKMAIESVSHECPLENLPAGKESSFLVRHDVTRLVLGPPDFSMKYLKYYIQAALSDVHRIFSRAKDDYTPGPSMSKKKKKGPFSSNFSDDVGELKYLSTSSLKIHLKKIEYMLAFVRDKL